MEIHSKIIIEIAYLIASTLFIVGIKLLGKPATARKGNMISAAGMLIAVLVTLINQRVLGFVEILICVTVGSAIGAYYAKRVEMTAIPQMVAIFNGFGGAASVLVAASEYWRIIETGETLPGGFVSSTMLVGGIIGSITLTGSLIAFGKLQGIVSGGAITFKGQHPLNALLAVLMLVACVFFVIDPSAQSLMIAILSIALLLGVLTVIPIGGADMPVVVSLLNSYSGLAACATGFVLQNNVLIIAGALVGASGLILTNIMCKGMNRSLVNVLLGGFGTESGAIASADGKEILVKEVGIEEAAMIFDSASNVIIVPGYGMAVAQAQHIVQELSELLSKKGINCRFAIHPVAGRMPGHMNVLLAEANVPYENLVEMDSINDDFQNADIALVIGANDVVNPAAKNNPSSPIYGMPVMNVEKATTVIVCKRGMAAGYAGIENELFGYNNCLMLFGDAKSTITGVVSEIKNL
ncbi:MAG: NAD(P) transhydrogenase subunit beta [Sphingobacteriales bacterium]|jgi:NAD(P) transhydrogenase subunit beta